MLQRANWIMKVAETYCRQILVEHPPVMTIVEWNMVLGNFQRTFAAMRDTDRAVEEDCIVCSRNVSTNKLVVTTRHDKWCDLMGPLIRRVETAFEKICTIRKNADELQNRVEEGVEKYDKNMCEYAGILDMRDYQHSSADIIDSEYPIPSVVVHSLRHNIDHTNFAKASRDVTANDVSNGLSCALCLEDFVCGDRATTAECTSWVVHGTSAFSFLSPVPVLTFSSTCRL
jgi:hypothetical protein